MRYIFKRIHYKPTYLTILMNNFTTKKQVIQEDIAIQKKQRKIKNKKKVEPQINFELINTLYKKFQVFSEQTLQKKQQKQLKILQNQHLNSIKRINKNKQKFLNMHKQSQKQQNQTLNAIKMNKKKQQNLNMHKQSQKQQNQHLNSIKRINQNKSKFLNMDKQPQRQKPQRLFKKKLKQQIVQNIEFQDQQQKQTAQNQIRYRNQESKVQTNNKQGAQVISIISLQKILQQAIIQSKPISTKQIQQKLLIVLSPNINPYEVLSPYAFKYYIFRFFKYQIFLEQNISANQMNQIILKVVKVIRLICLGQKLKIQQLIQVNQKQQNIIKTNKQISSFQLSKQKQYMLSFLQTLLPLRNINHFSDIFLQIGIKYLTLIKQEHKNSTKINSKKQQIINKYSFYMIQKNISRILFEQQQQLEEDQALQNDYTLHRSFYQMFLEFFQDLKTNLQFSQRISCIRIAKFLKVFNPQFIQYLKQTVQIQKQNYSNSDFLLIINYLIQSKNTPYQFFYKNKKSWFDVIEFSHDFSNKKNKCCIRFLQIFSRQRFIHCQQIYSNILKNIQSNLDSMEGKQLVRTLYFYSKAKYGVDIDFITVVVDKIYKWLPFLKQRQFSLLVRSIGNLNYKSEALIQKLKQINYQVFLIELKYGCENLGSYYQEILKEIQDQTRQKKFIQDQTINHQLNYINFV